MTAILTFSDRIEKRKDGLLHCEDGPAIEWATGKKEWYINGTCHRENGPAVEYSNGDKIWIENGVIRKWYCSQTNKIFSAEQ